MPQAASLSKSAEARTVRVQNRDFANQLRAAAADGDDTRIRRALAELLRCTGLSRGQRISLQQRALLTLVQSLRAAALNDEATGLHNRRGFVQIGTRVLDLAARDSQSVHLVYFRADHLERIYESLGRPPAQMLIRQTGNLLRDLFPDYGVHEVLGRLQADQFVALTPSDDFISRESAAERLCEVQRGSAPSLALSLGVAHFEPRNPRGIDELLEEARRDLEHPVSYLGLALPVSLLGSNALSTHGI
jgi:GGDEF domain-containing protein